MFDLERAVRRWRDGFARERTFSTSDLDELEDHLRAAYDVEVALDATLTPERAFAQACDTLGSPGLLSREFAKVEGRLWRRLVTGGWLLFAISFFLPVARNGITLGELAVDEGLLPGIQAFLLALEGWGGAAGVASALTNAVMAATFWRISDAGRTRAWTLAALTAVGAVVNVSWLALSHPVSDLFVGYYAWLASFAVVGTGLALRARALPAPTEEEAAVVLR